MGGKASRASQRNPEWSLCRRPDDGGVNAKEVGEKKSKSIEVFNDARFKLHKWHSNLSELEATDPQQNETTSYDVSVGEATFAKQQLGTSQSGTKLLGLQWNKSQDVLKVATTKEEPATTKRGALSQLAKIYDPLGLVSPTTLPGKLLYREMCEANLAWDGEFPENLTKRWKEWYEYFPEHYTVPRTLAPTPSAYPIHKPPCLWGRKQKRGCCSRVCSDRAREKHNPRSRVFEVSNRKKKSYNSSVGTLGWTHGCKPGHQCRGSDR